MRHLPCVPGPVSGNREPPLYTVPYTCSYTLFSYMFYGDSPAT